MISRRGGGGLLESGSLFQKGGLIEDLRYLALLSPTEETQIQIAANQSVPAAGTDWHGRIATVAEILTVRKKKIPQKRGDTRATKFFQPRMFFLI